MVSFQNKKLNEIKTQKTLEELKECMKECMKERMKERKDKIEKHNSNVKQLNTYNRLNIPFKLKSTYNSIIPLHLYTCWHTKDLPPLMRENYNFLVEENPQFTCHLYDEEDCRTFIKDNFDEEVFNTYNSLIPCAYKSDLWRYCVLYINGGIYMDIKYRCVNNFKLISLTEKEYFVRDRPENCVYNALIVTLPQNEIMRKCIDQIVENVKHKFYGSDPLFPTGPGLLGTYFINKEIQEFEMYFQDSFIENKLNEFYIVYNNQIILKYYNEYRKEQEHFQKNIHYSKLWENKSIYNIL
jgi:mannosyltransferase OCH1-like enzyme